MTDVESRTCNLLGLCRQCPSGPCSDQESAYLDISGLRGPEWDVVEENNRLRGISDSEGLSN